RWVILVCYQDKLSHSIKLTLYDPKSDYEIASWSYESDKPLSSLVVVDSMSRGYADRIYFSSQQGLYRICLDKLFLSQEMEHDPLFDMEIQTHFQPIIGRHPEGNGVLIYLMVKKNQQPYL